MQHSRLLGGLIDIGRLGLGKELAEWFKQTRSGQTKLLFTSGYVDENILKRHGLELGTAFLQKPFTPADLAKKVREVLDSTES